jgi:hypothetical protein
MIVIELNNEYEDLILDNLFSYSTYADFSDEVKAFGDAVGNLKEHNKNLSPEESKKLRDQLLNTDYNVDDPYSWSIPSTPEIKKASEAIEKKTQPIKTPSSNSTKQTIAKTVATPNSNAELIATGVVGAGLLGLGGLYAASRIRKRNRREKK